MKLNYYSIALLLILLVACKDQEKYPGFSSTDVSGIYYKVLSFEEQGLKPEVGDMIRFRMGVPLTDSLTWSAQEIQVMRYNPEGLGLNAALGKFYEGDSLCLIFEPKAQLLEFGQVSSQDSSNTEVYLHIIDIISEYDWLQAKNIDIDIKSKREYDAVEQYLEGRADRDEFVVKSGLWIRTMRTDSLGPFTPSEELMVMYTGSLLDGTVIDDRWQESEGLSYKIGMQGQLIPGLAMAIRAMDRADELEVILTSERAFGVDGSAESIVPPWTPVHYKIKVKSLSAASS